MLKRIIARLDIKNNNLVKGIGLEGVRILQKAEKVSYIYYLDGIDEISLIDVTASLYNNVLLNKCFKQITKKIFVPVTLGGGINNFNKAKIAFKLGADRISLNKNAVTNNQLLKKFVDNFGSSNVSVNIDTIYNGFDYEVVVENGKQRTGINLFNWIEKLNKIGVGEITVCSLSYEGRLGGYDIKLYNKIKNCTDITIIAHGGAGKVKHIIDLFKNTKVDAASLSSLLHFNYLKNIPDKTNDNKNIYIPDNYEKNLSILKIKKILISNGINVRY